MCAFDRSHSVATDWARQSDYSQTDGPALVDVARRSAEGEIALRVGTRSRQLTLVEAECVALA